MTRPAREARRTVLVIFAMVAALTLTLTAGAVLAAPVLPAGVGPGGELAGLPVVLTTGWRAAGGDPPDGVRGYRVLVDLSPFVGQPLAFAVPGIRDVDEAWFDGLRDALGAALSEETGDFLSSASIGTELFDEACHRTPEDPFRDADGEVYEAKEAFRAGHPARTARQTPSGKWSVGFWRIPYTPAS